MLAKSRGYIISAFCFLMFASISWAQIAAIAGNVKDQNGKVVKGAQIVIQRQDMKGTYKGAKTDKKGRFVYNGLPFPGVYTVSVFVNGQKRQERKDVRVQMGDPVEIAFTLGESQQQQAAAEAQKEAAVDQTRGMTTAQKEQLEKTQKENAAIIAKNKALNDAFNAGKDALAAKNYDAAVASFDKGTQLDPNQNVIWANLAEAYVGLSGTKAGPDKQAALQKAADAYTKAIALKPELAGYHNNYGLTLARMGKFDQAQAELSKAAELDPQNAGRYYYNLGAVYVNDNQSKAAQAAFQKAIAADPNMADAQYQYAVALSGELKTTADGKVIAPPGMKEALEKYLQLQPTGQFADAAKSLLQAIGGTIETDYSKKGNKRK